VARHSIGPPGREGWIHIPTVPIDKSGSNAFEISL
jgi:hypothetical protein